MKVIFDRVRALLKRTLPARIIVILQHLRRISLSCLQAIREAYLSADEVKLLIAAASGKLETVKALHDRGVNIRALNDMALVLAAAGGHVELVRYLNSKGADLRAWDNAALLTAAEVGHLEVLKYFNLHGVDVRTKDDAAVRLAASAGCVKCVEYLQRAGTIRADKNIHSSLKPLIYVYVDVFGFCNLRCPSCPVQNWPRDDKAFEPTLMTEDLLRRILDKATHEMTVVHVGLFNWTEPLLHPALPRLIEVVNSYGLESSISSNLNVLHDADALMKTSPTWFRISVSGFRQDIYERGHRWGDIGKVKENMRVLAEAKKRNRATTTLELFFHKYIDNEEDEAPMKAYAEGLGYKFLTGWAYMMPLEKVLTYADPEHPETMVTEEDLAVMDRLALRMNAMLDACSRHKLTSCTLQDDFLVLNVKGDAFLCCASSGRAQNMIGNFLELPFEEIQTRKRQHSLCGKCMKRGFPVYLNQADPVFDDIGTDARADFRSAWSKRELEPKIKVLDLAARRSTC